MSIAVIGLGAMGSRIARRLLDAGHEVKVWNRNAERAEPLRVAGASVAATPAEAVASADKIITMLADGPALVQVVTGPSGVREGLRPGQTLLEMSTVGPSAIHQLADLLPDGVELLDAPVLGSTSEAEAGSLRIFVGGTKEAVTSVSPVIEALGTPLHVGPVGMGAAAKLVANTTLLGTLALLGETFALARALGLDKERAFEVLSATPLAAQAERRRPVVDGEEPPLRFRLALAVKDADLIVEEGGGSGADARLAAGTAAWFQEAQQAGKGDLDYSTIVRHIIDTTISDTW